jgi:hypothetical protein
MFLTSPDDIVQLINSKVLFAGARERHECQKFLTQNNKQKQQSAIDITELRNETAPNSRINL